MIKNVFKFKLNVFFLEKNLVISLIEKLKVSRRFALMDTTFSFSSYIVKYVDVQIDVRYFGMKLTVMRKRYKPND